MNTLCLSKFKFIKETKGLHASMDSVGLVNFPRELKITSHHTGKTVTFKPVPYGHPLSDPDGWDGMQEVYLPVGDCANVDYVSLYYD